MEKEELKTLLFAQKEAYYSLLEEMRLTTLPKRFENEFGANSIDAISMADAVNETAQYLRDKIDAIVKQLRELYEL